MSTKDNEHPNEILTERELEVLVALASGEETAEIARRTGRSVSTVAAQRQSLCAKLGLSNLAELTIYALSWQLIPAPKIKE